MDNLKTIGIVGGGQLGRMLTLAAKPLGFEVVVLDSNENCPAEQVGARRIAGDLYDSQALKELADAVDVITIEIEHLNTDALEQIAKTTPVHPAPASVRMIQDKYLQKISLRENNIAVADFVEIIDKDSAKQALVQFGGEMILKTRHGAYDGRGNAKISSEAELLTALDKFGNAKLYAEKLVPFAKELAVMVARDTKGNINTYPVTETIHERNICIETLTPAQVPIDILKNADDLARQVASSLEGAGVFGIEMFLTEDKQVLVNEIAPRVHNSGHYTMNGCTTSQFEQHIRAITGLPLGDTQLLVPAIVMRNLLGRRDGETKVNGLSTALSLPNASVHLYGKSPTKIDRKMGHINVVARNLKIAQDNANKAIEKLSI